MKTRGAIAWKTGQPLSILDVDLEGPRAGVGAVTFSARVEPCASVAVCRLGGFGPNAIPAAKRIGAARIIRVHIKPRQRRQDAQIRPGAPSSDAVPK
jgi:Zn-dependent alcohol dehydrogenase